MVEIVHIEAPRQPDKPLADRLADLSAAAAEHVTPPVLEHEAWLRCDCCGLAIELDAKNPVLPELWEVRAGGDYCPVCA